MSFRRRARRAACLPDDSQAALLRYAANALDNAVPHSPEAMRLSALVAGWATAFGIAGISPEGDAATPAALSPARLRGITRRLRLRAGQVAPGGFECRLDGLAALLGLDPAGREILGLCLRHELVDEIETLAKHLAGGGGDRVWFDGPLPRVIGMMTRLPMRDVTRSLAPDAPLIASGALRFSSDGSLSVMPRMLRYARDELAGADAGLALLGAPAPAELGWSDFAHLGDAAEVAAAILAGGLAEQAKGVHLLLHGPPGTGKTEFAKALAQHIGAPLYPVQEAGEDGNEPSRYERLAGLRLAQRLVGGRPALLLVDEAEDLFLDGVGEDGERQRNSRVYMHRLLEDSPVPVIWTVNALEALSPAVRRRMLCCLEIRVPPAATRAALWRRLAAAEKVALADADAEQLAREIAAPPALARSALRAARLAGGDPRHVRMALLGTARALFGSGTAAARIEPGICDNALLNADIDLAALAERLSRPDAPRAVSLLLSGPPGSGKSLYARHLAACMGLEVMERRASDLLDAWLGGTEKAIAAAFAEAREAGGFLIFDEADSLLGDRGGAMRSWEVSQVNEMLTWMERHPLPFVCTTNLADRLDPASLRRFLVKARFAYLSPHQVGLAFQRSFGIPLPAGRDALGALTPADFALVLRKAALLGQERDPQALCAMLAAEAAGRHGGVAPIGFTV